MANWAINEAAVEAMEKYAVIIRLSHQMISSQEQLEILAVDYAMHHEYADSQASPGSDARMIFEHRKEAFLAGAAIHEKWADSFK